MITIQLAGVSVGIDNQYDFTNRVRDWRTEAAPDFTVRVPPEELAQEDLGRGLAPEYLEFICAYRHIAERMPDYDAFVVHGAAVVMDERAYLFTAPSGTGKTTHVRFWRFSFGDRAWYLNGDKPILRKTPAGFTVCGTPWRGKEGNGVNAERPIQGICLLHRGQENRIAPAESAELVRFLARQIYIPSDPDRAGKLLDLLDECCRSVPTWSMDCSLNIQAAGVAWEAMRPASRMKNEE